MSPDPAFIRGTESPSAPDACTDGVRERGGRSMPVMRFLLECRPAADPAVIHPHGPPRSASSPDVAVIMPFVPADGPSVALLAEACRSSAGATSPRISAGGLVTEFARRPGREVHGWLAWEEGPFRVLAPGATVVDRRPLGAVALIETGGGQPGRFSIAWLLVDPAARRRGIATALVRQALAYAAGRGGEHVWAETLSSWTDAVSFWRSIAGALRAFDRSPPLPERRS